MPYYPAAFFKQTLDLLLRATGDDLVVSMQLASVAETNRRQYKAANFRRDKPKMWENGAVGVKFQPSCNFGTYGILEQIFRCQTTDDLQGPYIVIALVTPCESASGSPLPVLKLGIQQTQLIRVEMIRTSTVMFMPARRADHAQGWTHNVIDLDPA